MPDEMKTKDGNVHQFPKVPLDPAEIARRLNVEVRRLARMSTTEWMFWVEREDHAAQWGTTPTILKRMVAAQVKANEKQANETKAEERRQEQRAAKERDKAAREQDRQQAAERKAEEKAAKAAAKAAEAKRKELEKGLAAIAKLPTAEHEARLVELATRLALTECELDALRDDFYSSLPAVADSELGTTWNVEPWPEPVATADILDAILTKFNKHIATNKKNADTAALWTAFDWLHEKIATHSPMLNAISPEEDSGKSTLLYLVGYMSSKPIFSIEPTGPNVYRIVDRHHPTLIIDEADSLFERKSDLRSVVNGSWIRGAKVMRYGHQFDPFCPKMLGVKGTTALPRTIASRSFNLRMFPMTAMESKELEEFNYADDDEFRECRRKLRRWSDDNAEAIKALATTYPTGMNNRTKANWSVLFKVAQHAGGKWLTRAHEAATYLSRTAYAPSKGIEALAAMAVMMKWAKEDGRDFVLTAAAVAMMTASPDSPWRNYRGQILSQYELAALYRQYDMSNGQPIAPVNIHPTKTAKMTRRGYRPCQFKEMFARFADRIARVDTSYLLHTRSQDDA
jgi:putative DNA primase/helicase